MRNINNLSRTSNFKVFLPILSEEVMYCQGIQLPGISINPVMGYNQGLQLKLEGDTYTLDPITIDLILDENFILLKKIYSIFKDVVHPNNGTHGPNFNFECAVEVTDNSGIPVLAMELHNCALQNITPVTLLANSEDDIISCSLSIEPSYYEIIDRLSDSEIMKRIVNG